MAQTADKHNKQTVFYGVLTITKGQKGRGNFCTTHC